MNEKCLGWKVALERATLSGEKLDIVPVGDGGADRSHSHLANDYNFGNCLSRLRRQTYTGCYRTKYINFYQ